MLRVKLKNIHQKVFPELCSIRFLKSIFGVGSFFRNKKLRPEDLDYYITFSKPFSEICIRKVSEKIEGIKNKFRNSKFEPVVNVFLEDSNGDRLNSVDLWFLLNYENETLSDCIKSRKGEVWKGYGAKLLFENRQSNKYFSLSVRV